MGKAIDALAFANQVEVIHRCNSIADIKDLPAGGDFVAIEFTQPDTCMTNIKLLAEKGINTVVGTTGWLDNIDEVTAVVAKAQTGLLYSSNFSIGVHMFWEIVRRAGELTNKAEMYDVCGHEYHHMWKKDSPSGTALSTANIVLDTVDRKDTLVTETLRRPPMENELHFTATRAGHFAGTHTVHLSSDVDEIAITHTAKSRDGFALGALKAAQWLHNKKGVFTMKDFMKDYFST